MINVVGSCLHLWFVNIVLLYRAKVWGPVPSNQCYRNQISILWDQRIGSLWVVYAYRTVSGPAILVIAGVVPVHLLVPDRQGIHRRILEIDRKVIATKKRNHNFAIGVQSVKEPRGRWTTRLTPNVTRCTKGKYEKGAPT